MDQKYNDVDQPLMASISPNVDHSGLMNTPSNPYNKVGKTWLRSYVRFSQFPRRLWAIVVAFISLVAVIPPILNISGVSDEVNDSIQIGIFVSLSVITLVAVAVNWIQEEHDARVVDCMKLCTGEIITMQKQDSTHPVDFNKRPGEEDKTVLEVIDIVCRAPWFDGICGVNQAQVSITYRLLDNPTWSSRLHIKVEMRFRSTNQVVARYQYNKRAPAGNWTQFSNSPKWWWEEVKVSPISPPAAVQPSPALPEESSTPASPSVPTASPVHCPPTHSCAVVVQPSFVGFVAYGENIRHFAEAIVILNKSDINIFNCFDTKTGNFTVPKDYDGYWELSVGGYIYQYKPERCQRFGFGIIVNPIAGDTTFKGREMLGGGCLPIEDSPSPTVSRIFHFAAGTVVKPLVFTSVICTLGLSYEHKFCFQGKFLGK